jgi:hypothetical protein
VEDEDGSRQAATTVAHPAAGEQGLGPDVRGAAPPVGTTHQPRVVGSSSSAAKTLHPARCSPPAELSASTRLSPDGPQQGSPWPWGTSSPTAKALHCVALPAELSTRHGGVPSRAAEPQKARVEREMESDRYE